MALQSLALARWKSNEVVLLVQGWIGQMGGADSSCLSSPSWELGVDALISCQRNRQAYTFAFASNYLCRSCESREELLPNC